MTVSGGYGAGRNWKAQLTLEMQPQPETGRTVLGHMGFSGPLRVQRPFYPEGEVCHLYVLHPPGGMVSGDELAMDIRVRPAAHSLMTTPSAGKIYQADSCNVRQHQKVRLDVQGTLEWLPQETIVFNGANGCLETEVHLGEGSRFIAWDIFCLGRLAGNHPFQQGSLEQRLQVYKKGIPCLLERQRLIRTGEEDRLFRAPWGFGGATVSGTLIATVDEAVQAELRDAVRALLPSGFACTSKEGLLIIRYLGQSLQNAKSGFLNAWQQIRPQAVGRPVTIPRIWHT